MKSKLATESGKAKSIAKKATGKDYTPKDADLSNAKISYSIRPEECRKSLLGSPTDTSPGRLKEMYNYSHETIVSNAEAINKFFSWYGPDTHSEFSNFFFDLLVAFINNEPDGGYSDNYKDVTMLRIRMLNDLVKSLVMQDKIAAS